LNNSPGIPGYEGTQIADDGQTAPGKDFLDSSLCWKGGGGNLAMVINSLVLSQSKDPH
jgi:hypothetical protein